MKVAFLIPPLDLGINDRFRLTAEAGPKLQPKGIRIGRILADMDDCWKVRFDGANHTRVILKRFIEAERGQ